MDRIELEGKGGREKGWMEMKSGKEEERTKNKKNWKLVCC